MKKLCFSLYAVFLFMNISLKCFPQGFYDDFSWGAFVTPAKDQLVQGPCHIFAALAQVESMYNLIYFGHWNLDLSEYQLNSHCTYGDKQHIKVYEFLKNNGVVKEACSGYGYPSECDDFADCFNYCADEEDDSCCICPQCDTKYRISFHRIDLKVLDTKKIQDSIYFKGPIQLDPCCVLIHNCIGAGHSLLLHGWEKQEGRLKWIFKDSWPGEAKKDYMVDADSLDLPQLFNDTTKWARIITSVDKYTRQGCNWNPAYISRGCTGDVDGDGYCQWGTGPKPCSHGTHSERDYDDGDITKGPLLTDGYAKGYAMPLPNVTAPVGQTVIYGPPQSGYCSASHTLNSSYWKNITGDNIDWVPYYGSTPTSYTGPSYSAPGATGLYLYLEPTGGCYNQKGIVESKYHFYIPSGSSNYALKYYYHMYGSTMGTLKVKIQTYPNTTWEVKSTKSGNQGNSWYNQQISLTGYKGKYIKIRFEGTTGYGQYSDMAIQNISIPYTGSSKSETTDNVKKVAEPEKQAQVFTLFPNPASNQLNIITKEGLDYNLLIYNTLGQLVYNEKLKSSQVIDVSILAKGIYIVRIKYKDPGEKEFKQNLIIN